MTVPPPVPARRAASRFVMTGPTGWVGQAMLSMLGQPGGADALQAGDTLSLFGSRAASVADAMGRIWPIQPLDTITADDVAGAHVIHLAYLTKDKVEGLGERAFHSTNTAIDDHVLGALNGAPPASLFIASSGAAQLAESGVDRHPYGVAKLEQEARFLAYARTHAVPILCGRIFNLAGPHINKRDAYAVSNFIGQSQQGGPIHIQAAQPVFRSFLHVDDLCRIVLRAARRRIGREQVVDLCGAEVVELQQVAALVIETLGFDTAIERPTVDFNNHSKYLGQPHNSLILAMQLGIELSGLRAQVRDTIDWMGAGTVQHAPGH